MTNRLTAAFRSWKDRTPLRHQLGLTIGLLTLLVVGVTAVGAVWLGEREARKSTAEALAGLAATLSDRFDRWISLRVGTVDLMAKVMSAEARSNADGARTFLDEAASTMSGAGWLGFVGVDGIVKASARRLREGESVANEAWFARGLLGLTVVGVPGGLVPLSGLSLDGKPSPIANIAAPVHDGQGRTVGVIVLSLTWIWAADLRQSTLNKTAQPTTKELWILGEDGKIVLGPQPGAAPFGNETLVRMRADKRGAFTDPAADGQVLTGFAGLSQNEGLKWIVVARQRADIAFRPARQVAWFIVLFGAMVGAVGIAISFLIARGVSRPLTRLAESADLVERDSVQMLPREGGSAEVVRLSGALRSLVARIGSVERRAADVTKRYTSDIAVLRNLASTDELTGLFNRRTFLDQARDALQLYRDQGRRFAVMMIDIDRFKAINDELGHAAGDRVIRDIAGRISNVVRPGDLVARFGGEEFVVLVYGLALDAATRLAERIRVAVAATPMEAAGTNHFVTISVGVAVTESFDKDVQGVIERADLALYAAKRKGRNAVVAAAEHPVRRTA